MHPDRLDATFRIPMPAPIIERPIANTIPNAYQKCGSMHVNTCFHPE